MVKEIARNLCLGFFFLAGTSGWLLGRQGCASGPTLGKVALNDKEAPKSPETPETPGDAIRSPASLPQIPVVQGSLIGTAKMAGAVSGLSISANGRAILVATSPDIDIEGSSDHYFISWLNSKGHLVWKRKMNSPVKEQDLAADGSFAVIANYSDEILAWDSRGHLIWSAEGMCRPHIINLSKKILCYHDDDADPTVAFDIFDWKGKKLISYPIAGDVLALKVSPDERNVAIGLTGGQVVLFNMDSVEAKPEPSAQAVWQKAVEGEIVDVAASSLGSGEGPRVAVMYKSADKTRKVALFDKSGNLIGKTSLNSHPSQLEFAVGGKALYTYGNGHEGQAWGAYSVPALEGLWKQQWSVPSEYSSSVTVTASQILVGWEEVDRNSSMNSMPRRNHLLRFDLQGRLGMDLQISSEEGAYLYAYRLAQEGSLAAIATDDARVKVYKLK